jgi:hypothetical protein
VAASKPFSTGPAVSVLRDLATDANGDANGDAFVFPGCTPGGSVSEFARPSII